MKLLNQRLLEQAIDSRALNDVKECKVMGLSLRICQDNKILMDRVYGEKIDSSSVFRLASMTKPITAVSVMTLAEKGVIDILDPVKKYLPEFSSIKVMNIDSENKITYKENSVDMTLLHLLTHTSGICNGKLSDYFMSRMSDEDIKTLDNAVKYYSTTALDFEPYTANEYSPIVAFDILAKIVEKASDTDFNEYLHRNIFEKCEMTDTTFTPSEAQIERIVPMHARVDGKNGVCEMKDGCIFGNFPSTHYLGGAGLVSTLSDYSNFASMLLNDGSFNGNRVLTPESVKLLSTPHVPKEIMPHHERWGLGVRVIVSDEYLIPKHSFGWSGAYGTHFWVDPVNKITAVYMRNSTYDGGAGAAAACTFERDVYSALG